MEVLPVVSAVSADDRVGLAMPLESILGKAAARELAKMDLATAEDLLYHFPFRLARRGELMPIGAVSEGESVTVVAEVLSSGVRQMRTRRGHILSVEISDGSHRLSLTFFGKNPRPLKWHESRLSPGTVAIFSGTVSSYRGNLQLSHPDYELIEDEDSMESDIAKAALPIPIYHASAKMPSWKIAKAVTSVLGAIGQLEEPLPQDYLARENLMDRNTAIRALHAPQSEDQWRAAAVRIAHEEAFILQAALAQRAWKAREQKAPACPPRTGGILEAFDSRLPYTLTAGQLAVGAEISAELAGTAPMSRLLQGDVGSGKTVVALRAMLQAVDAGSQAALLAPTSVLARQHYETIVELLGPLGMEGMIGGAEEGTRVVLLTGSMGAAARRKALGELATGRAGIVVGTHALLSEDVAIPKLALAVVDEQHRFGVDQRSALSAGVHTLVMTATPIPRTIAMSVFGDLEVSTLKELPAGRQPVSTTVVPASRQRWVERVWERAAEEVASGGRVYVVCPRIGDEEGEPSAASEMEEDERPLASVLDTSQELAANPALAGIGIGIMHGRLKPEEKTAAMDAFSRGEIPVLVSTTVIEVGVDVPEATMMVILDAERFGLSQLHQLRGRIGRGDKAGLCLALTAAAEGTVAAERLNAFAATTDGFELAEKDLELRNEGDVLGASQSGRRSHLRFLSVTRDAELIATAREAAREAVAADPELAAQPALAREIARLDERAADYMEKN